MDKPMFAVKDRALDTFALPFTMITTAQAVRSFTDEINNNPQQSQVAKHPDDYDLYVIAHYDERTAEIKPLEQAQLVVRGKDLLRPQGE